jgi:hypothetical protein
MIIDSDEYTIRIKKVLVTKKGLQGYFLYSVVFAFALSLLTNGPLSRNAISVNALPNNPIVSWNQLITKLSTKEKFPPTKLARAYSLVNVAIYDALLLVGNNKNSDMSPVAVAASAASGVLSYLFPNDLDLISKLKFSLIPRQEQNVVNKSIELGSAVGLQVVNYAKNDGSELVFSGPIPSGQCIWNGVHPVTAMAAYWKTYILKSGAEIQPPAPAACGSKEDIANIKQVTEVSHKLTSDQIAKVHYWGDKLPPAIWNNILNEYIKMKNLDIFNAARASAYLNVAIYDSCISTWYTKYSYWTARPFQRINNFLTVIPTPNFPGYTSGHSTMSAAAASVMAELFPNEKGFFYEKANEAKISRLWAGIHFNQDNEMGAKVGLQIGQKVVEDMRSKPHQFIIQR